MAEGQNEINDAYRQGQYDMRKRIENYLGHWYWSDIGASSAAFRGGPNRKGSVSMGIRREMKVRDLSRAQAENGGKG